MLNRLELRGITLSPGLDRRKLSLNGFVADGRVKVLGAFFQALQEAAGRCLAVASLCKEKKMLRMLVGGAGLAKRVPENGTDIHDALAARRASARENDFAHQTRLLLRDDLRDETAEREAQQIDFAKTESAYESDGNPSHLLDRFGGRTSGSADPTIVEHNNVVLRRQAIHDPRIPIVQYRRQMVEEHHGDAALLANLSEHEVRAVHIDRFGRRIFKGHAHRLFLHYSRG